ncbi:MAG: hypothetical protein M1827_001666 [Pycnora praestabilis]|nr:MAG: hypothetical protein M1827_001666 [Pycnora praestabilis]
MPVSHIGLTVTHLPASCSFFLSALQPLGYRYLGHSDDGQIGFGPLGTREPEFFIAQESEWVKAGAAHIAFRAPSRRAVSSFYASALNAGGRPNGPPAVRDPKTGHYNAAVSDFDDNSIEVVWRGVDESPSVIMEGGGEERRVLSWQKDVARSLSDEREGTVVSVRSGGGEQLPTPPPPQPRTVVDSRAPLPVVVIEERQMSTSPKNGDGSTKELIGTLLGAAAGAAAAYAMVKSERTVTEGPDGIRTFKKITRILEAPVGKEYQYPSAASVAASRAAPSGVREIEYPSPPRSTHSSRAGSMRSARRSNTSGSGVRAIEAPPPPPPSGRNNDDRSTLIDTYIPSEVRRSFQQSFPIPTTASNKPQSRAGGHAGSHHSRHSRYSHRSSGATAREMPLPPKSNTSLISPHQVPLPASGRTSVEMAKDMPLPRSTANSAGPAKSAIASVLGRTTHEPSVAPSDSISQAGSRRSSRRKSVSSSKKSGRVNEIVRPDDSISQASWEGSGRTLRAGNRSAGRKGSGFSVPRSLPMRFASKAGSKHGSVAGNEAIPLGPARGPGSSFESRAGGARGYE